MSAVVVVFAVAVAACGVAHAAILISVIRSRSTHHDPAVPRPRPLIEVVWALVPVIALALVLTATWARIRDDAARTPPVIMKVAR